MSVINRLATTLGRRDDVPNRELARELAETKAVEDIRELVANLQNRDRKIQSDCIKVLYEVGYIAPELIAEYGDKVIKIECNGYTQEEKTRECERWGCE